MHKETAPGGRRAPEIAEVGNMGYGKVFVINQDFDSELSFARKTLSHWNKWLGERC